MENDSIEELEQSEEESEEYESQELEKLEEPEEEESEESEKEIEDPVTDIEPEPSEKTVEELPKPTPLIIKKPKNTIIENQKLRKYRSSIADPFEPDSNNNKAFIKKESMPTIDDTPIVCPKRVNGKFSNHVMWSTKYQRRKESWINTRHRLKLDPEIQAQHKNQSQNLNKVHPINPPNYNGFSNQSALIINNKKLVDDSCYSGRTINSMMNSIGENNKYGSEVGMRQNEYFDDHSVVINPINAKRGSEYEGLSSERGLYNDYG